MVRQKQSPRKSAITKYFIVVAATLLAVVTTLLWLRFAPGAITVTETYVFQLNNNRPATNLVFSPGSTPRLRNWTMRASVDETMASPRLIVSGRPGTWSLNEITSVCPDKANGPEATMICLFERLREKIAHVSDGDLQNGVLSSDVLAGLNYHGVAQCGEVAHYLGQLAEAAGFKARVVHFGEVHSGVEVFWEDAWHFFDADRGFFYTDQASRQIVSIETLRRNPNLYTRSPGRSFGYPYYRNKVILTEPLRFASVDKTYAKLPAEKVVLPPGSWLKTEVGGGDSKTGSTSILEYTASFEDHLLIDAPFPLLSVEIAPVRGRIEIAAMDGRPSEFATPDDPAIFTMPHHLDPWLATVRSAEFSIAENEQDSPLRIKAVMRRATASLPTLQEGGNHVEVHSLSPSWHLELDLKVELRAARN